MINLINNSNLEPYLILRKLYHKANENNQQNVEAICISSYSNKNKEVDARFVNLKYIDNLDFIFFSNYNSPKSKQFKEHNQISVSIYWSSIDVQIRMKSFIKKIDRQESIEYFKQRSPEKNALAISSKQSNETISYHAVLKDYNHALNNSDLNTCPNYWGGFKFRPYYFEFWEGHESRINRREVFERLNEEWNFKYLQP